jgi:hypothetical protein
MLSKGCGIDKGGRCGMTWAADGGSAHRRCGKKCWHSLRRVQQFWSAHGGGCTAHGGEMKSRACMSSVEVMVLSVFFAPARYRLVKIVCFSSKVVL